MLVKLSLITCSKQVKCIGVLQAECVSDNPDYRFASVITSGGTQGQVRMRFSHVQSVGREVSSQDYKFLFVGVSIRVSLVLPCKHTDKLHACVYYITLTAVALFSIFSVVKMASGFNSRRRFRAFADRKPLNESKPNSTQFIVSLRLNNRINITLIIVGVSPLHEKANLQLLSFHFFL